MDISSDQLPHLIAAVSAVLGLVAITLCVRAFSLRKSIAVMAADMAQKPVAELVRELEEEKVTVAGKLENGNAAMARLQDALANAEAQVHQIEAGLPPPNFKIDDDESLKDAIRAARARQLKIITGQGATTSLSSWSWFGSKSDGRKLISIYNKLMISAFNAEFDMARDKMRHNSFDAAIKKFDASVNALEKLAETVNVMISPEYLAAKEQELGIWHADLERRQAEKEARKQQKAIIREQNKTLGYASDDDDEEDEIENQLIACSAELEDARERATRIAGDELARVELEIAKIEEEKQALVDKLQRATAQAQITRAGYVYVISNIGSFGEGVCKIGMTRRLEPMARVVELGDASVPYRFDVHTLAFVDDAPKLEKELHRAFNKRRVNKDNPRKEFFFVAPEEVRRLMDNVGIQASWYFECDAREYRESELMREAQRGQQGGGKPASAELPQAI